MKKIAVLLTVHNRKAKTLEGLRRLYSQALPDGYAIDVYLTDDGCTDGTPEAVSDEFPKVNIVKGDGNLFWNRGMYKAWEAASEADSHDYYLWLNDDTFLYPDAVSNVLSCSEERPGSVIVGATNAIGDKNIITYSGYNNGKLVIPNGNLQPCETFNGNFVLIPRNVYQCIGNLDWTYRHAIGDNDYGWMVTHAGLKNYVTKTSIGECNNDSLRPKWMRPEVPFKERWANFHSPLAYGEPGPFFHYNLKNFGIVRAVRVWLSNHVRVFLPGIFK